jgi:hypothetical protein
MVAVVGNPGEGNLDLEENSLDPVVGSLDPVMDIVDAVVVDRQRGNLGCRKSPMRRDHLKCRETSPWTGPCGRLQLSQPNVTCTDGGLALGLLLWLLLIVIEQLLHLLLEEVHDERLTGDKEVVSLNALRPSLKD